jgi:hypothetical protein
MVSGFGDHDMSPFFVTYLGVLELVSLLRLTDNIFAEHSSRCGGSVI